MRNGHLELLSTCSTALPIHEYTQRLIMLVKLMSGLTGRTAASRQPGQRRLGVGNEQPMSLGCLEYADRAEEQCRPDVPGLGPVSVCSSLAG